MDAVIRKLEFQGPLTQAEKTGLREAFAVGRQYLSSQEVMSQGRRPQFVGVLLSGFLCRYRMLPDGQRQICGFVVPGDVVDLNGLATGKMDHSIAAMSRSIVATADAGALNNCGAAHPRLWTMLWRDTLVEASISREWIVNCGRRDAHQRMAHLICEVHHRLAQVGHARALAFDWPLTQADLADATGLSVVHVNRTLQRLRGEGLISLRLGRIGILDWEGLSATAGFDEAYLTLGLPDTQSSAAVFPVAGDMAQRQDTVLKQRRESIIHPF